MRRTAVGGFAALCVVLGAELRAGLAPLASAGFDPVVRSERYAGPRTEVKGQTQTARDVTAAPTGTGVIAGTVVTDEPSPRPLRRVSVMLASGELRFPQTVVTDNAGRFAFANLAAGNYTIVGTKPTYVQGFYGAKRPGRGPGVPIAVLEGQQITNVTLKMMRGGVITGVVRGQNGQPAPGFNVQVYQVDSTGGSRRLTPMPTSSTTDDRGVYRAFGLAPGDYLVQIMPMSALLSSEARLVAPAEVRWADQAGGRGAAGASGMTPGPAPPTPGQTVSYAPVYYPGTPDAASAATVTVASGEERSGVDLSIAFVPTARVTGSVLDPDGRPFQGAQLSVGPAGGPSDFASLILFAGGRSGARSGADGAFSLGGVTPGQYTLTARASPRTGNAPAASPAEAMLAAARMLGGSTGTATWWASTDLTIEGRDVSDLVLRLQPGMTVSGKIEFDSSAAQTPDVTKMRLSLMTPPSGSSPFDLAATMLIGGTQATIAADGTFTFRGVTPGKYRLSVSGMGMVLGQAVTGSGWTLKSAMLNGRDIADVPVEIKPNEDATGLVVTVTDRPTEVSGAVIDQAGRPAPGFPIIVFSTDRAYWTVGSRRIQQARPSSDGKYKLTGLPAGEYYVCAVTDLDPTQLYDPAFLETLSGGSFKITLADGEKKTQDLKLAGGQERREP
jgi:protocatechuate 3,4-dioxygenase beta subunit